VISYLGDWVAGLVIEGVGRAQRSCVVVILAASDADDVAARLGRQLGCEAADAACGAQDDYGRSIGYRRSLDSCLGRQSAVRKNSDLLVLQV